MKKIIFILFITISSFANSQDVQVVYTNVLHGDTAFLVKITNTYQLDSQIRFIYTNHLECDSALVLDTMKWVCNLILDTAQYFYPFKTLISSVRDSSQVTHPKIRDTIIWIRNQISNLINNNSTGAGRDILNISTPVSNSLIVITSAGNSILRTEPQIKQDLQLDQLNNTSDANKPISTATQTALNNKTTYYTGTDAGANDSYVVTLSPVPPSLTTGMIVIFRANTANTTGCTLNVNGLGVVNILKRVSTTPATGDILALQWCMLIYNGTNFIILNPVVN